MKRVSSLNWIHGYPLFDSIAFSNLNVLDSEWFGFDVAGILIRQRNSILKDSSTSFKNLVISLTQRDTRQSTMKKK